MDVATCLAEGGWPVEKMKRGQTKALGKALLGDIEALSKLLVLSSLVDVSAKVVDGPAKQ